MEQNQDIEPTGTGVAPRILAYMMDKYVDQHVRLAGLVGGIQNGMRQMQCCEAGPDAVFNIQFDEGNDPLLNVQAADVVGVVMNQPGLGLYLRLDGDVTPLENNAMPVLNFKLQYNICFFIFTSNSLIISKNVSMSCKN